MSHATLDPARIQALVMDCLFRADEIPADGTPPENAKIVRGVVNTFGFHPERLESHRAEVRAMLDHLPDEFFSDGGGGWSFMNLPMTKDGHLWGEQRNAEELLCLAIGLDLAEYALDRDLWSALPGGMPYVVFHRTPVDTVSGADRD